MRTLVSIVMACLPATAMAEQRQDHYAIENMTCALCPLTVKMAMSSVQGVLSVSIDFATKTATVIFDDAKTDSARITEASTNAGYPASSLESTP